MRAAEMLGEPVGWRRESTGAGSAGGEVVADVVAAALHALGVRFAFGVVGGGIAPFAEALQRSPIRVHHFRHEAGAVFAAVEAYFRTGEPAAVFVTTGPGLLNALNAVVAARWDGAQLVLVSGATTASRRGRWAVQETSAYTLPLAALGESHALFDYAVQLADPAELEEVVRRLRTGLERPAGFVAHLSLPLALQSARRQAPFAAAAARLESPGADPAAAARCAALVREGSLVLWVGHGARGAADAVRALAERTGACVMCSPRAKGIFPEGHPRFLGVTGAGGHVHPETYFSLHRPDHVLVLGTRLGEVTSFWSPRLRPARAFLHVDCDPASIGVAYPDVPVVGFVAEIGAFLRYLLQQLPPHVPASPAPPPLLWPIPPAPRAAGPVRPQLLLQAIQDVVVDGSDAPVLSESGNSFAWANHHLRFGTPGRYRTSAAWGSMGHMTTGVVGAALAGHGKAVALVGDGAMLMNNEISTAVAYGAPAVWIVLNDAQYGITDQAMRAQGLAPVETQLPRVDFVAFARSMGADGVRVAEEAGLEAGLEAALAAPGPFVVDVWIDRTEVSPVVARRIASLEAQGGRR